MRRFCLPLFSSFGDLDAGRSPPCARTCVPPQGCRSTGAGLVADAHQPDPPGAARRLHREGADQAGILVQLRLADPALADRMVGGDQRVQPPRSAIPWSAALRRSKSSRERSAPICPPVTPAPGIRLQSRCSAVCMRMWRWRGVQSSTAVTRAPTGGSAAPSAGRCRTRVASALHRLGDRRSRRRPSAASRHRPAGRRPGRRRGCGPAARLPAPRPARWRSPRGR